MDYKQGIIILSEKGKNELKTPKNLKMEERSLLVMVDCSSTGQQLLDKARGYPNAQHILEKLVKEDYLSVTTEVPKKETQDTLQAELKQAAIDILGLAADDAVKKLENTPVDKQALILAIKQIKQMVYLTVDEKKANAIEETLKKIVEKHLK
jgi:aspartyl/asparaginyl-tRNA synthetase